MPPPWKPAAKPARSHRGLEAFGSHTSHSLDGGITYKPLTRGWVPFTRSGWVLFTLSKRRAFTPKKGRVIRLRRGRAEGVSGAFAGFGHPFAAPGGPLLLGLPGEDADGGQLVHDGVDDGRATGWFGNVCQNNYGSDRQVEIRIICPAPTARISRSSFTARSARNMQRSVLPLVATSSMTITERRFAILGSTSRSDR